MFNKIKTFIKGKFDEFNKDERGVAAIWALVTASIAIAALVIIFAIIPMIGYQVDTAVPIPGSSNWNSTTAEAAGYTIVTGVQLWSSVGPLIKLVAIVSFLGLVIASVIMLAGRREGEGGV